MRVKYSTCENLSRKAISEVKVEIIVAIGILRKEHQLEDPSEETPEKLSIYFIKQLCHSYQKCENLRIHYICVN